MHLTAQSREFCWRKWVPIPAFRRIHHRQHNHIRRILNRRLAEKEAACYGENCRVQSDSQSQRENYGGSKSWILAQHAQAIAQVLEQSFEEVHPTRLTAFLLCALDAAKLDARQPQGFIAWHTASHQILSTRFDVETQLRIHFAFHARAPQNCAQPGAPPIPQPHTSSGTTSNTPANPTALIRTSVRPSDRRASLAAPGCSSQIAPPHLVGLRCTRMSMGRWAAHRRARFADIA